MPIQQWSDQIIVADLTDDPQFTDELSSLTDQLDRDPPKDVVLDMQGVTYVNSSNIAKLLRVRKAVIARGPTSVPDRNKHSSLGDTAGDGVWIRFST